MHVAYKYLYNTCLSAVPPCKVQRLHYCSPSHQESNNTLLPSTPSRPTVALGSNISNARPRHALSDSSTNVRLSAIQNVVHNEHELHVASQYNATPSPPSPPSLSGPQLHQALPETSAEISHKERSQEHKQSLHKSSVRETDLKTPTKGDACFTTPLSSSKYHRTLEPSVLSPGKESPKTSSVSVMDRFNAVYQSLTSKPMNEQWDSELQVASVLDITSGSHSQGVLHSSDVLRRAPACPYITVTGSDGERVYLKLRNKKVSTFSVCV